MPHEPITPRITPTPQARLSETPLLPYHSLSIEQVCAELDSTIAGLSQQQVAERRQASGFNELKRARPVARWRLFAGQFRSAVVGLLIAATVISGILGDWADAFAILTIVLLNAVLGYLQEDKSRRALETLQRMSAPAARVVREGQLQNIPARDLVPGDVVHLESGDHVPADVRLLDTVRFGTQEAALTGESEVVHKDARAALAEKTSLAERHTMVYAGTTVARGKATGLVVATGMHTELGKIARLLEQHEAPPTPLELRLDQLGKTLMAVCIVLVFIIFLLELWRGGEPMAIFLLAVSLAVAAVPEGLPAVVTMSLALGLERMAKRNALVRRLASVETLGSVTTICSDKTGTLTRNEMTLREIVLADHRYHVTGAGFEARGHFYELAQGESITHTVDVSQARRVEPGQEAVLLSALHNAARCTTAQLVQSTSEGSWTVLGDPTEGALLTAAAKAGIQRAPAATSFLHEIPFESERKAMSVVVLADGGQRMITKGAPELLLRISTHEASATGAEPLHESRRQELAASAAGMAGRALRVLALATRSYPADYSGPYEEAQLTFVGLFGLLDPPREEVRLAVQRCKHAGIRPIMITGDHPQTANAIARELVIGSQERVATGDDLDAMNAAQLAENVDQISVYARVSAEHKQRIVHALQARGHIVAMTGDGVNDAPAISAADIGIAMGLTGTDVTKAAADMVLTDDNFASIVNAVEEGRAIFDNIRRVVLYLLSTNAGEVLLMFAAALAGWPLPLLPIQLLWMNLITDGLPALTLGMEPPGPHIMSRPPRSPRAPVISWASGLHIVAYGALFAFVSGLGFLWVLNEDSTSIEAARTVAFCTACYAQMFFALGCRSNRFVLFQLGPRSNLALLGAIGASGMLQLGTVLLPLGRRMFGTAPLALEHWLLIGILALIPVTVLELGKLLFASRGPDITAGKP